MAQKYFDKVRHLITTTGAGNVTFGSVPAGWRGLSTAGAVDGDSFGYEIIDGPNEERGRMAISGGVTTGTRTVESSTNSNAPINLTGAAVMTCVLLASDFEKALKKDIAGQVVTGGVEVTELNLGTPSAASTLTIDVSACPQQYVSNGAAFVLSPGTKKGTCVLDIINISGAGTITLTGWTRVDGAAFLTTTNGNKWRASICIGQAGSTISIVPMQ